MPGGTITKFSNSWLIAIDLNGNNLSTWCWKRKDDFHAYYHFCDNELCCENAGKAH